VETARKQAREQGHALRSELKILMLHGLLHLAGYDHEIDDGKMARREMKLREKLGLPRGLIERAGSVPQGLKPRVRLVAGSARLKPGPVTKPLVAQDRAVLPSGAKARVRSMAPAARLKSGPVTRPFVVADRAEAPSGAKQAAEKPRKDGEDSEESPAGAKARPLFCCICGPAKAVPLLQNSPRMSFSASCKARTLHLTSAYAGAKAHVGSVALTARLKSSPDTKPRLRGVVPKPVKSGAEKKRRGPEAPATAGLETGATMHLPKPKAVRP
jgi:hypothetical protein